ncbi:MAG: hypothetical protein Q4A32_11930, partial [Lachnospiraceae bacterium]|nr:hypothetical protein [Lachnospiraceae bacterium]
RLSKREKEPPPVSPVSKMLYGIANVKVPCLPQNSLFVKTYEQMFIDRAGKEKLLIFFPRYQSIKDDVRRNGHQKRQPS